MNVQANGVAPAGAPAGSVGFATGVNTVEPAATVAVSGRPVDELAYVETVRIVFGGAGSGVNTSGPGAITSASWILATPEDEALFP